MMEPWYKVATPRKEVREGRSFSPDEFAIALEQVVAGTAPEDYKDPQKFFSRTCFTRALKEHTGMVLRRLAGRTENTAPVLTLITQFGGGKTHTLTALYHLARHSGAAGQYPGVPDLLKEAGLSAVPHARVAVFVGNAWDPGEGRETPWIDVARRFAQPLGIHLDDWKGRIIEIEKGGVRLLAVSERARQLFGTEGAAAMAERIEREPTSQPQLTLFTDSGTAPEVKGRGRGRKRASVGGGDEPVGPRREATTLDRIHAAMLLQASGRTNALRALLKAEQEHGPDFLRLANALSALYPKQNEEKRLLDAMLLAVPR